MFKRVNTRSEAASIPSAEARGFTQPLVSRAVVNWAKERQISTLVIGDVREVADGKRLNIKSQQKIGLWSHGRQRHYITYKAATAGIAVTLCPEAYTSQTCPQCQQCYKPKGRTYRCPACGFTAHRDGVGAANILSQHYTGEPGHVLPPPPKYRYPSWGKRSPLDTRELAWGPTVGSGQSQEAAALKCGGVPFSRSASTKSLAYSRAEAHPQHTDRSSS